MDEELIKLNSKIRFILEEKEIPAQIKEKIEKVYQEYIMFYNENLKSDISNASQGVASRNIEEYIEENYLEAMERIKAKYKEKCTEKAEVITIVLSTLEPQKNDSKDEQMQKSERDILDNCVRNPKENYLYTNNVINIVIDSIENSRNQLFRILDSLGTTNKKMEYINSQIKLIENSAKLKLSSIKEDLDIDDEEISKQIFSEYEQYKENEEKNKQNESQNAHQTFVNKYIVSEEDLQVTQKTEEETQCIKEKVYEELPGELLK